MTLAERLEQRIPEILRQWEAHVRSIVPAARHESRPVLLDSIPEFLEELVKSLAGFQREDATQRRAPKKHAKQRADHPAYSLEQVIQEYSLLRGTILDVLWPVEQADLRIILDIIDAAVAEATTQYVQLQASALRESEERFRLLVGSVKEYAIYMLDPEGRIVTWNQGAERITGYTAAEIVGQHVGIFYPAADRTDNAPMQHLHAAAADGRIEVEGVRIRKDGTQFFAHVVITAVRREDGVLQGFSKVVRDITERRALESELQKRADALAEANRHKDEFLAVLGHELRNPLAPIVSAVALLRRRDDYDPTERQAIEIIDRQGKHLIRLVDDLLDVARITRGKITLRKEPLELNSLLSQVVETIRPFAMDRAQTLTVSLPPDAIWLEGDATRLSQVFANLLHNSLKFTEPGGRIELRGWVDGAHACVEVCDTGMGLDPDSIPHMFDLFVQGEQPTQRIVSGLGVGLALVRTLVDMHRGCVTAYSEGRGRGSRFVVHLPLHHVNRRAASAPVNERGVSPARVMVVDDNVDAATTTAKLLEMYGHIVTVAHHGKEAIERALADPPDAIVLDIGLPGVDGYEVARTLRTQPSLKHVRLIALSGFGREEDKQHSLEAGFAAHLTKPADLMELQQAIAGG